MGRCSKGVGKTKPYQSVQIVGRNLDLDTLLLIGRIGLQSSAVDVNVRPMVWKLQRLKKTTRCAQTFIICCDEMSIEPKYSLASQGLTFPLPNRYHAVHAGYAEPFLIAIGPHDFNRVNFLDVSQPEVRFAIAAAEVAVGRQRESHEFHFRRHDRHLRANGVTVARHGSDR